ncbi:hypothetical protein PLESTB_001087600 [Pleodorina starrii]|uniref:RING-type domain-containing protein n=1 Tax=Pleodorina starrii TaxID=330485 RepID=A0A9W6F4T4_9CHLO|nr:hypothetical protein PLESTM_000698700 [Pleodorina starrii]GLC56279.1 hypothetical protein PLESTB_001087600 [Pleodorina starrii]GLC69623.1 hypothetical protein PLESTF_000856000 [Pleodorina starrii]
MDAISENLRRAQEAIARARELSSQLSSFCLHPGNRPDSPTVPDRLDEAGPSTAEAAFTAGESEESEEPVQPTEPADRSSAQGIGDAEDEKEETSVSGRDVDTAVATLSGLVGPVRVVAQQLASLQRKQNETLQQLLVLRMQQLKLRQQQLTALQELLTAEMAVIEGTPLQVSAVEQAVGLLSQSLHDMKAASRAMLFSRPEDVQSISAAVSATDSRADEVSRMARQLLGVLRAFPRRGSLGQEQDTVPGASASRIASLPTHTCTEPSPLLGQTCCICLGNFSTGDQLKSIQCVHYHHAACLDEWLRIKACCPLCKAVLPES